MTAEASDLRRLLRAQLTAVNQQFVHILALKTWGAHEAAERIAAVDAVDFPTSMKIMGYFASSGAPLDLAFDPFAPGDTLDGVYAAERAMERRMAEGLSIALAPEHPARAWIAEARAPRAAYAAWLAARAAATPAPAAPEKSALDAAFASLIAVIEQAMAHAFVHWRRGDAADADAAWALSGVAMTQAGALTRAVARTGATPNAPDGARLLISERPDEAFERDREAAEQAGRRAAAAAAAAPTDEGARGCREIAAFAQEVVDHRGGRHPALAAAAPAFRSFRDTRARFGL